MIQQNRQRQNRYSVNSLHCDTGERNEENNIESVLRMTSKNQQCLSCITDNVNEIICGTNNETNLYKAFVYMQLNITGSQKTDIWLIAL